MSPDHKSEGKKMQLIDKDEELSSSEEGDDDDNDDEKGVFAKIQLLR